MNTKQKRQYIEQTVSLFDYGITTYSPGDYTRYRITKTPNGNYFSDDAIFTGTLHEMYVYCQALRNVYNNMTITYLYKCVDCTYDNGKVRTSSNVQYYENCISANEAVLLYAYYALHCLIDKQNIHTTHIATLHNGEVYQYSYNGDYGIFQDTVFIIKQACRPKQK